MDWCGGRNEEGKYFKNLAGNLKRWDAGAFSLLYLFPKLVTIKTHDCRDGNLWFAFIILGYIYFYVFFTSPAAIAHVFLEEMFDSIAWWLLLLLMQKIYMYFRGHKWECSQDFVLSAFIMSVTFQHGLVYSFLSSLILSLQYHRLILFSCFFLLIVPKFSVYTLLYNDFCVTWRVFQYFPWMRWKFTFDSRLCSGIFFPGTIAGYTWMSRCFQLKTNLCLFLWPNLTLVNIEFVHCENRIWEH